VQLECLKKQVASVVLNGWQIGTQLRCEGGNGILGGDRPENIGLGLGENRPGLREDKPGKREDRPGTGGR
jgi:hypothetical protein